MTSICQERIRIIDSELLLSQSWKGKDIRIQKFPKWLTTKTNLVLNVTNKNSKMKIMKIHLINSNLEEDHLL